MFFTSNLHLFYYLKFSLYFPYKILRLANMLRSFVIGNESYDILSFIFNLVIRIFKHFKTILGSVDYFIKLSYDTFYWIKLLAPLIVLFMPNFVTIVNWLLSNFFANIKIILTVIGSYMSLMFFKCYEFFKRLLHNSQTNFQEEPIYQDRVPKRTLLSIFLNFK